MAQLLAGLDVPQDIKEQGDFLGGPSVLDSGLYDCTVDLAYIGMADSGAQSVNVTLKTAEGKVLRQTFWITSGKEKGCKPFFITKTGEKQFLPGYTLAESLCLLTIGKRLPGIETEEKVIQLYSPKDQKEIPTKVQMITEMLGKQITAGVIQQIVAKNKKNDQTGAYEPTGETRKENEVDKFFRAKDGMTVTEIKAKATEAKFKSQWNEKWEGQIKDKTGGAAAGSKAGVPGAPGKSAAAAVDNLFV